MTMSNDLMTLVGHIILGVLGVAQTGMMIWNNKIARKIDKNTNGKNNGIPYV